MRVKILSFVVSIFMVFVANAQTMLTIGMRAGEKSAAVKKNNLDTNLAALPVLDTSVFKLDWNTSITHLDSIDLSTSNDTFLLRLTSKYHPHFVVPVRGEVRDNFRWRTSYRHHNGLDIKLKTGDTVYAAFDGLVRYAQYNNGGYGRLVIVRHNNGLETYYAHFSQILVDTNQYVKAGTPIGLGGSTGRSSGPHLHFEVRYLGNAINPEELIDWECESLCKTELEVHKDMFKHIREMKQRKYYYVKRGDSLGAIARKNGTSVTHLCRLNGIRKTSVIHPGQKIRVR